MKKKQRTQKLRSYFSAIVYATLMNLRNGIHVLQISEVSYSCFLSPRMRARHRELHHPVTMLYKESEPRTLQKQALLNIIGEMQFYLMMFANSGSLKRSKYSRSVVAQVLNLSTQRVKTPTPPCLDVLCDY